MGVIGSGDDSQGLVSSKDLWCCAVTCRGHGVTCDYVCGDGLD